MILPTKHLSVDSSLLGIGAKALAALEVPTTMPELWRTVRHEPGVNNFDRFCGALVFLYLIGLVDLDRTGTLQRVTG
jgi:hypothetical protein